MSTTQLVTVTPTRTAVVIGRAIFDAIEARKGVAWDTVPEGFRKLYARYGAQVEAALYAHSIRPAAPPLMVPPRLVAEIRDWAVWWKAGGVESNRRTRRAAAILVDLAGSLR